MTSPTPEQQRALIIQEMIEELRQLQGSGEYVPLTRLISTGTGLTGGGSLESNRSISLTPAAAAAIDKVTDSDWVLSSKVVAAATANTIPIRDAAGRMKAANPSATNDVATLATVNTATERVVRNLDSGTVQIAVRSAATHDPATEVAGVIYFITD